MNADNKDDSLPRPRKIIPGIRQINPNQRNERRPYNQGYNRQEDGRARTSYHQPDNNRGEYREQRQSSPYGERSNRPYDADNRSRGYNRPYADRPARPYRQGDQPEGAPGAETRRKRFYINDSRPQYRHNEDGNRPFNDRGRAQSGGNYNRPGGNYNHRDGGRPGGNYNPNAKYNFQKQLRYKEELADPTAPIRLNRFLANAGVCSRREADEYIQAGVVTVNGQPITQLGARITRQDKVMFHDRPVQIEHKVYIILNKPKNYLTTSNDPNNRLIVMDLIKKACRERVYPIGRLDRNSTGVMLFTNDGDLAAKLLHPSFKKKKIYHVWLDRDVAMEDMQKIADGIELADGEIHADAISYANETDKSQVGIEIHSGRNRIVRRIFESLGYNVKKLDRVYFAGLTKKNLPRGKWRYLSEREVSALKMGAFE